MLDRRQLLIILTAKHPVNIPLTYVQLKTTTKGVGLVILYNLTAIYAKWPYSGRYEKC
jgi:hypothetical protein